MDWINFDALKNDLQTQETIFLTCAAEVVHNAVLSFYSFTLTCFFF